MIDLIAGDDWQMDFELQDPDDSPFDLTGAQILWTLIRRDGRRLIEPNEVYVSITDFAGGLLSVLVPATVTTRIAPSAIYSHALRVISGGIASTPFTGQIDVIADPWAVQVVTTQAAPNRRVVQFPVKMRKAA